MKHISILLLENGSNGHLLRKISSEKAEPMWRRKPLFNIPVAYNLTTHNDNAIS